MEEEKEKNKDKLSGFYRAKVIDNKDPKLLGRVMVWIPDVMPKINENKGLWAQSANNVTSGLNADGDPDHFYSGSCYVPPKGSYVFCFFENGNPNRPYYLGGLDLQNTKVLPECQTGGSPEKKWVVYKSHAGRAIVISDDPDDERVEITGKKRQISSPPVGDLTSVFTIEGNQTTILIDERSGKEKILIKSHKGDFINFDIQERKLNISMESDIHIKSNSTIFIQSTTDVNIKAGGNINLQSGGQTNMKGGGLNSQSSGSMNLKASGQINMDGSIITEQSGESSSADDAIEADPIGER